MSSWTDKAGLTESGIIPDPAGFLPCQDYSPYPREVISHLPIALINLSTIHAIANQLMLDYFALLQYKLDMTPRTPT